MISIAQKTSYTLYVHELLKKSHFQMVHPVEGRCIKMDRIFFKLEKNDVISTLEKTIVLFQENSFDPP